MSRYKTEEQVKQELEIDDWRHITKDKVMQFASSLHKMDPEVAKKALEQFPNFASYAGEIVKYFKDCVDRVLVANTKQTEVYCEVCSSIIKTLQRELDREELTSEQRDDIIKQMVDLAGMIQVENKENRSFWLKVLKGFGGLAILLAGLLAAALGAFVNHHDDDDDMDNAA